MTGSASKNRNGSIAEIRDGEPVVGLDVACDKASGGSEVSRAGESEYSSKDGTGRIELRGKELEEALSLSAIVPISYSSIFITGMSSSGSFFLNENIVVDQKKLKQKIEVACLRKILRGGLGRKSFHLCISVKSLKM